MKLTVSRYYLPTGRSIQRNYQSLTDSLNSDTFYTLLQKRKMVDGNGIHPDIEYPGNQNDSIQGTLKYVMSNPLIDKFVLRTYQKQNFTSPKEFVRGVDISTTDVLQLVNNIRSNSKYKFPMSTDFIQKVQMQLRNKIAYNYYGTEYFHYCEIDSENWLDLI